MEEHEMVHKRTALCTDTRQQLTQCNKDVENVVSHGGCQRKELNSFFSNSDSSIEPGHNCCSNCRKACKCEGEKCGDKERFVTHNVGESSPTSARVRELNEEDLLDIKLAMKELQEEHYSPNGRSLMDLLISMLSFQQVMDVLEVFQEMFEDMDDFEEQTEELLLIRREVSQVEGYVMLESVMSDVSIWGCKDSYHLEKLFSF